MAKRKKKEDFETNLFWFLATAYIADVIGLLDPAKAAKLSSLEALAGTLTWQEHVEQSLDLNREFVEKIYALCRQKKNEAQSIGFILRGLGCPCADERMAELLG